jgi:hypothetical protein
MTITEMHLNIDLELNKLNSNLYDIILPQEKDYFLNRAQERFIKQRYSPKSNSKKEGFEMSQKRIDDLKALLVPNYYDKCYRLDTTDFDYSNKLRFYMPDDYMFLTSNRSKITYNPCGTIIEGASTESFTLGKITLPNVSDYSLVGFKLGATVLIAPGALSSFGNQEQTLAVQYIIQLLNSNATFTGANWKAYSRFKNIISDIVVKAGTGTLSMTIDGTNYTSISTTSYNFNYLTASGTSLTLTNRFAQQDDVYIMQQDPFNKTSSTDGPLVIINSNNIDVFYEPNNFIVNEIAISYLRKPKLMSISINQSCELDEETHAEIVRDCVNLLLENFEADKRLSTSLGVEATNE